MGLRHAGNRTSAFAPDLRGSRRLSPFYPGPGIPAAPDRPVVAIRNSPAGGAVFAPRPILRIERQPRLRPGNVVLTPVIHNGHTPRTPSNVPPPARSSPRIYAEVTSDGFLIGPDQRLVRSVGLDECRVFVVGQKQTLDDRSRHLARH
jgi:hypothetical protein